MKKILVLFAVFGTISAQASVLGSVSSRVSRFLAPTSPSFDAAYPCGRTQVFTHGSSSIYTGPNAPVADSVTNEVSSSRATVVCEGRSRKLSATHTDADGRVTSNEFPLSRSAYSKTRAGRELRSLVRNEWLIGGDVPDEALLITDFRESTRVISGVTYRTVSVKIELIDEGEKLGYAEMEFAAGMPRGEEMISYHYMLDLGQIGGTERIGSITELVVPATQR